MKRDLSITWVVKVIFMALVILSFVETVANGEVTLNYQISAGNDDGYTFEINEWLYIDWLYMGYFYYWDSQNQVWVYTDPPYPIAGMRFQDVSIPQGAIITNAQLKLRAYSYQEIDTGNMYALIEAEDRDNPPDFSVTRIDERPKTSASVNWDYYYWDPTWPYNCMKPNVWVTSPDISSVIQEVINRPGWTYGNPLVIICSARVDDRRHCSFHTYESSSYSAPKLEITLATITISGYIERPSGTAIEGVSVTVDGSSYSAVTDSNGYYELVVPQIQGGWSGTVRASKSAWSFQPASYSYINVTGDLSDQDFTAIGVVISGYTTETWGEGVEGVLVSADNNGGSGTSNGDGYYELVVPLGWSGMVTPSKASRTFEPPNRSYTNLSTDISGQDFVAERIWAYGSGTAGDPYLIYTPEDMNNIGAYPDSWDKHFKLMADIDLDPNTGTALNTIGISSQLSFTGVFDGNGKTISNFTYNRTGWNFNGLFRSVGTYDPKTGRGEIKNLGLINPDVNAPGGRGVGALVGVLSLGTITNCYAEGAKVSGSYDVGGLVGCGEGDIINCHASGNVDGDDSVGGLIGCFYFEIPTLQFKIMNCYSSGVVSGNERVGGLIGVNQSEVVFCCSSSSVSGMTDVGGLVGRSFYHGKISNCYSRGDVLGGDGVGGLVGRNQKEINHCYSSGSVSGTTNVGGLVGIHEDAFYYTESFWDSTVNPLLTGIGNGSDPDVIGESTTNMKKESTFTSAGWDFVGEVVNGTEDIWTILEEEDYPKLSWEQPERVKPRNISMVRNGSFESDGYISGITVKAPRRWCDVNVPSDKFGGEINTLWSTHGNYSLRLYSRYATFTAGDMAAVSQQVYLTDVNQIIFDLRLGTIFGYPWDPSQRSALVLIDGNVVWDSNDWLPDASGEYRNQIVDVNEVYKDTSPHILSLAMRANVSGTELFFEYLAQWDFVKFDTYCGGFGYLPEDLNHDCYVDILDLRVLTEQWLTEELNQEYDLFEDQKLIINFPDFATFASYWQNDDCRQTVWCGGSDFNRSGAVDFADLMMFAEHWLGPVTFLMFDLTGDKLVNFSDYAGLTNRWLDNTDWMNWQDENCFELELPASDLNYDGIVNLRDFAIVIGDWMSEGQCIRGDIDGSELVYYDDIAKLADEWLLKSWLYGLE